MFGFKKSAEEEPWAEKETVLSGFDYSTRSAREITVGELYAKAKNARTGREVLWVKCNDYYNSLHDTAAEMREAVRGSGIPWDPAVVPDPYIMVESQIDPMVPEPEFRGRDDDMDSARAKQREYAVKYVCQKNRIEDLNTANERRLKKLGDAFWKVYWDQDMRCGPYLGDIRVRDVPVEALYVDPTAGADGIQAGQYVDYVYAMHKVTFWQRYGEACRERGLTLDEVLGGNGWEQDGMFDLDGESAARMDDTVCIVEHWFKHPVDVEDARADDGRPYGDRETEDGGASGMPRHAGRSAIEAGTVGCSIQAGGHEVQYIPDYWVRTGKQNKLFPFVHAWCIRDENQFYNRSELEPILPMVDAADRELATALLNDAFMANDIVLIEEGALVDGGEFSNVPGAEVRVRQNRIGGVARLGGLSDGGKSLPMVEWCLGQIQRTNRNFETNQGKASSKVKTATELSMLRSDVDGQMAIKKADRNAAFERLYELIDWTALEFYDDGRVLFLGAEKPGEDPVVFSYNSENFAASRELEDPVSGERMQADYCYYPVVDVTVNAGDGIIRSKAATLQALETLGAMQVTQDNWRILAAQLEVLDIPQKQDIVADWERKFASRIPPEVTAALEQDPELMEMVMQAVAGGGGMGRAALPGTELMGGDAGGLPQM